MNLVIVIFYPSVNLPNCQHAFRKSCLPPCTWVRVTLNDIFPSSLMQVDLLSRLQSPYLVELLGYCADLHHRLLIFEFMPNGTLHHHLHPSHSQHRPLDWGTRLRIAFDCARALEFLHEYSNPTPVIHRDFKCTNVLLDQNFRAKVSDFGLAKMGSDKIDGQISTRVLGTTGYLAPE